ncbi:unnamed protein product [Pieris brassicae]|uniref:Uncharacterized protein n=1 Tax=Pieris brassicae TaxID=7116 RepID=A0A9P0SEL6_PIEBR|nr:unnamed protein product [Pieris brassicae]
MRLPQPATEKGECACDSVCVCSCATRTAGKQRWLGLRLCDEGADGDGMQEGSAPAKRPSALTIDRAAFLLLRVKRAFKKKRQQRKEKQYVFLTIDNLHCNFNSDLDKKNQRVRQLLKST